MGALGFGTRQAARRLARARGADAGDLRDVLLEDPWIVALYDPSDAAAVLGAADEPVGGTAMPVARLLDLKSNRHFVQGTAALRPLASLGLWFDGNDDYLECPFAGGTGPAALDFVCVYKGTDPVGCLLSNTAASNRFAGLWQDGLSEATHSGAGAPSYRIDGEAFAGTRSDLCTALADGVPHIVELRGITMTTWSGMAFGTLRNLGGAYFVKGVAFPVAWIAPNGPDLATTRENARVYAADLVSRLGL